jgi:NAD(P)H-dependent FMN reductase
MERIARRFDESDGFCVVTGEYNHGLPPALSNILDHFQPEYLFKPCAIACYSAGRFGGVRAAVHLRAMVGELGMASISSMLAFGAVQDTIEMDGTPRTDRMERSAGRFLDEFVWYMEALQRQRTKGRPF